METSKSRSDANHKPIAIPSFILKFQLPIELLLPMVASNLNGVSIVSNSTRDDNEVMSKLSQTCRYFYSCYQPTLEKRAAKKLLECFFMPTKTNVDKAKAILLSNPKLAFVQIENDKTITDIVGRGFEGSLLQAAMQTKAVGWLNWLKKEVIEETDTQLAKAQYREKFGHFDERKERMLTQLNIDLKAIEAAFIQDPCTNGKPTLQATLDAFKMMRQHFDEENKSGVVIKTGEFFPLEIMEKICEVYRNHWDDNSWSDSRLSCYSRLMIGFALRFFVADDLLRLLKGLDITLDEQNPLFGDFKLNFKFNNNPQYNLDFTRLDKYSDFRLGFDFFIDTYSYYGMTQDVCWPAYVDSWKSCVEQKREACRTYAATERTENVHVRDLLPSRRAPQE